MTYLKKRMLARNLLRAGLVLVAFFMLAQVSEAQVTIGSSTAPNQDALLDLKQDGITKGGLLLPRVALVQTSTSSPMSAHTEGMLVYNTATIADVSPGVYYNDGNKWMKHFSAEDSFFYMPSTALSIDENDPSFSGGVFTADLYSKYRAQFGLTATNVAVSDVSAKLPVYTNSELHYFITYYDGEVFEDVKVSAVGVLTYKVKTGFVFSEKTYMNIIFKVK